MQFVGERQQVPLGNLGVGLVPSLLQHAVDPALLGLGQVPQHISFFVFMNIMPMSGLCRSGE